MQGTHASGALEEWVADIAKNENATMLRDSMVDVQAYDEFRNMLEVDVSRTCRQWAWT
jgi:hypothetical protein